MSEEAFGDGLVTSLLQQDVEFGALLIDCTPLPVRFTTKGDEPLIEVPRAPRLASRRFHSMSKVRTKFPAPAAICLLADGYVALEQQLLNVAQAEPKAKEPA
ncbi:hypothetical protein JM78_31010 [Burkholderia pyrrocinia]|nr:hypothetical protein JM78_31010 [Burkholderia pyrrocinia]